MHPRTLIVDNGAHSIKALWSDSTEPPEVFRNSVVRSKTDRRNYVGDELDQCQDYGGLTFRMPFERGILTNWDVEKQVWDRVFGHRGRGMKIDPTDTPLLITEPIFNLPNVRDHYDQMIFEEYEFPSYLRVPGPALIPYGPTAMGDEPEAPECVLVVDAGFSFTHVVPVLRGTVIGGGVRRIDAGGKLLTNHLKELVSFRQWYMMDQTSVMEHAKEECCYVTEQWENDWEEANSSVQNSIVRTYVLPDFTPGSSNLLGFVRTGNTPPPPSPPPVQEDEDVDMVDQPAKKVVLEEEQLMQMNNERFTVPEVLFNPSTIDLNQAGLSETIAHSISALPQELQGMFWGNIVCVGGSSAFPGFAARLRTELRSFAPFDCPISVTISESPTLELAVAASRALTSTSLGPAMRDSFVTRQEYLEAGSNACRRKFNRWYVGLKDVKQLARNGGEVPEPVVVQAA